MKFAYLLNLTKTQTGQFGKYAPGAWQFHYRVLIHDAHINVSTRIFMITVDSNNIWPRCSVDQISNYVILLVNMTCLRGSAGDGGGGGSVWLYYVCN